MKYLQIVFLAILPTTLALFIINSVIFSDFICYVNDENGVNLHGHVNVTKQAATELSKGMNTIGTQIGLGATMVGVGSAVGKSVAKSSMPPFTKGGNSVR